MNAEAAELREIHEVLNLYTHIVDSGHLERLAEVMTTDARFVVTGAAVEVSGVENIAVLLAASSIRPLMHLTSNAVIDLSDDGGHAVAKSKVFTPKPDGSAGLSWYIDSLIRTVEGWRIFSHVVEHVEQSWGPSRM